MSTNKTFENDSVPGKQFETDSQKVVRQHLEDRNHVISEEDIRNVRVGVNPMLHEQPKLQSIAEEMEAKEKENLADKQTTPWDVVEK